MPTFYVFVLSISFSYCSYFFFFFLLYPASPFSRTFPITPPTSPEPSHFWKRVVPSYENFISRLSLCFSLDFLSPFLSLYLSFSIPHFLLLFFFLHRSGASTPFFTHFLSPFVTTRRLVHTHINIRHAYIIDTYVYMYGRNTTRLPAQFYNYILSSLGELT